MAIDKTGKLAMDVYSDLKPHQQKFLDDQFISETNPLLEITALGDNERRWLMYADAGRNVGKTMMGGAIRQHREELIEQVTVTGVDAGSKEHVIHYTIDEADDLFEAMALTMDSMDIYNDNVAEPTLIDWKTIEEKRLRDYETYIEGRRIPTTEEKDDIWLSKYGVEPGKGRGPKGGAAQRLAKRRKANKAARKARRK